MSRSPKINGRKDLVSRPSSSASTFPYPNKSRLLRNPIHLRGRNIPIPRKKIKYCETTKQWKTAWLTLPVLHAFKCWLLRMIMSGMYWSLFLLFASNFVGLVLMCVFVTPLFVWVTPSDKGVYYLSSGGPIHRALSKLVLFFIHNASQFASNNTNVQTRWPWYVLAENAELNVFEVSGLEELIGWWVSIRFAWHIYLSQRVEIVELHIMFILAWLFFA